jgi:hypothetical protein
MEERKMKSKIRKGELKVDDVVFIEGNAKRIVRSILPDGKVAKLRYPDGSEYVSTNYDRTIGLSSSGTEWLNGNGDYLLRESGIPNYILVYDRPQNKDPIEYFATMPEVKERIDELLKTNQAIATSIRIITVAKVESIDFKITLKAATE